MSILLDLLKLVEGRNSTSYMSEQGDKRGGRHAGDWPLTGRSTMGTSPPPSVSRVSSPTRPAIYE